MNINELSAQIRKINHQRSPLRHPADFFHVLKEYQPLADYMLKRFGRKSWYSFWYTKLFVADEGGEYDLRYRLYRRFPGLLKSPFKLEVEHTTVCNKKCMFCMHTHWAEKQGQMSFDRFKYIIDSIPSLKWLNIAGIGSAFLHKDFIEMLTYARQKHINVNFVDEFDFFDEEKAAKIIEIGINSVYISFDAAKKETYERMKKGCSFERAVKNIKTLLDLKEQMNSPFPVVHFRFLTTRVNFHEMPGYVEFVASLPNKGVRSRLEFIGLITYPGIEDNYIPLNKIPEHIMREVYVKALKYRINLYFSHSDTSSLPPISDCVRWTEPFVLFDGEVIPDCAILMQSRRDFLRKISFGNAFNTPFLEIWRSKRYRCFRRQVVSRDGGVPESCMECCTFDVADRANKYGKWTF